MELEEINAEVEAKEPVEEQEATPAVESAPEPVKESEPEDIVRDMPKRKKTAEERIAEITWKFRESQRTVDELKKKVGEPAAPVVENGRPKIENFESSESYEDALVQWHLKQRVENDREERRKTSEAEALRNFNLKAEKVREIHEDFDEVIESPVFTTTMRDTLMQSDQGPVIAYYLGRPENRAVALRIASLPDNIQSYEIGKLETQLLISQKAKKVSTAPEPFKPVGSGGGSPRLNEDDMSDEEWVAMDRKRTAEKKTKPKYGG